MAKNNDVNLARYLDVFTNSRWLIAIIFGVVLTLGAGYAFLARPVYQADILLQVDGASDTPSNAKSPLGDVSSMFDVKTEPTGELEVLGSRMVVGKAVDSLNLYISAAPKRFPLIGDWLARDAKSRSEPGLFGWGGFAWGNEGIKVSSFTTPEDLQGEKFDLIVLPNDHFRIEGRYLDNPIEGKVGDTVVSTQSNGKFSLQVAALNANPGTEFVLVRNSREKTVEDLQDKLNIVQAGKDSGIIKASLTGNDRQLVTKTLNEIGDDYIDQNLQRKAAEAEKSLAFLSELLPQLKSDLESAELRYNEMRTQRGVFNLSDQGKADLDETVAAQRSLMELQQKRAELVHLYTPGHPLVAAVDAQIAAMNTKISGLSDQMKALPDMEQNALRLSRDVQVDNDLYVGMLNNLQQLKLVRAGKVGTVRLLDHAVVPKLPIKPNKLMVLIYSAAAGLLLGSVAAFIRAALFGGVTDRREIEDHTGLNVYATVPLALSGAKGLRTRGDSAAIAGQSQGLLASQFPYDPTIESLRGLRSALHFAMLEANNNRIMLTGPTQRVGKSFVSANLAAVMSAAGKRVLLIDADFRKGRLEEHFGEAAHQGLSDYLASKATFDEIIQRNVLPGLDFVAKGNTPSNPSDLLLDDRMEAFLARGDAYDVVLFDTPPVLAVSDAAVLAHRCGTVFLVARFEETSIDELIEAAGQLKQVNAHVKGVIFNGFDVTSQRYSAKGRRNYYASYLDSLPANVESKKA